MTLEGGKKRTEKKYAGVVKEAAFGAALLGAGGLGAESGIKNSMEEINRHVLTPAAIVHLTRETGATDRDIARLEAMLLPLVLKELKRSLGKE